MANSLALDMALHFSNEETHSRVSATTSLRLCEIYFPTEILMYDCRMAKYSQKDTAMARLGLPIMTSNPNFVDYVERVQENLAVLSLTDDRAKLYLMESRPLAKYDPRFIAFEILFNHKPEPGKLERRFDPHISDKLFEQASLITCLKDLKRLYRNAKFIGLDLATVDWSIPPFIEDDEYLSEKTKDSLKKLPDSIQELNQLHESLKTVDHELTSDESLDSEISNKLTRVKEILDYILQKYEVQYIPTNVGSTALVYEAWKQGKLVSLGNPEDDQKKFDSLLSGLFLDTVGKEYQTLMREMAENLGLDNPEIRYIYQDQLSNTRTWVGTPEGWGWFTCVESALIHKLDLENPRDAGFRYLIYYPLIIDDYWFAGVAFIYSSLNFDPANGDIPEIFNRQKYSKIYNTIKSVSDTLKLSLREEALKQAEKRLRAGIKKEDVFIEVLKDYFVCFNVRREGEENQSHLLDSREIYKGHGIRLFGPVWLTNLPDKLKLIEREIDGYDASVSRVPGLFKSVDDLAQIISIERDKAKGEGIEEQSQKFSHQAVALMNMVWLDPERKKLSSRSRAGLWHLKTVAEVVGKIDLEAERLISEIDFPEWQTSIAGEIIQEVVDLSLSHALERATLQRLASTVEDKKLDKKINDKAFEILKKDSHINEFKRHIGLSPLLEEPWADWAIQKGFILCFYHVFWQAAYHAFRSACGQLQPLQNTQNAYLKVLVGEEEVEIRNVAVPPSVIASKSRDTAFFEDINEVQSYFRIEDYGQRESYWSTKIFRISKES
ncbi:hypothetical protein ACQ4N7_26345 [Nodosilinea sp. AN01ver1]|uniref:hypothetical protein n=1 Tax=Nodosilinea sp. AN01ver1 TaxID=3423362 RepID=UPI003D318779